MKRHAPPLALAIACSLGVLSPLSAAETARYTPEAFDRAQKAGDPILVEITAPWCPTCKVQKPILDRLEADPKFGSLHVFEVDFDSQKDVVRQFEARMQSTLIAFKGRQEVARSVGDTKPGSIAILLDKSI